MGLSDCSMPAPVSKALEVSVVGPPGTSSGVDAMQPRGWLSLDAIASKRLPNPQARKLKSTNAKHQP
jgi:hypothetical protein